MFAETPYISVCIQIPNTCPAHQCMFQVLFYSSFSSTFFYFSCGFPHVPWFPLCLFSKLYSSCSVTVCVPILFIPLKSITYQLLAATVLCSHSRSPSRSCPADYMLLLPVFCVFSICKPL